MESLADNSHPPPETISHHSAEEVMNAVLPIFPSIPGVRSRHSWDEISLRFHQTDIVVIDLDQCLFPGFSQTALARRVLRKILLSPFKASDHRFLPQLLRGGLFIVHALLRESFGYTTSTLEMMSRFEAAMKRIPLEYFLLFAKTLPSRSYPGSLETIRELSHAAPVGIISLSIDLILREFQESLNEKGGVCLAFFDSNELYFEKVNGRTVFLGYKRSALRTDKNHKGECLIQRMAQYGATRPFVIGHNCDDLEMVRIAKESGGLSMGFNPPVQLAGSFDVQVTAKDWKPIRELVRRFRRERQG
jgi:phosphoserine phosphatase